MHNLFLAATRHNEGKTVISLGLTHLIKNKIKKVGYFKPIGRATVEYAGDGIDGDVPLIKEVCGINNYIKDMNPACISGGFPAHWNTRSGRDEVVEKIKKAYSRVAIGKTTVLVEGTGNAAAGASFGLSNAGLAKQFNSKVLLIASGGIGQPIDEIILNKHYFDRHGAPLMGVIINKAYPHEIEKINSFVKKTMDTLGIRLLGVIPYVHEIARPLMRHVLEEFKGTCLNGEKALSNPVGKITLGAASAHYALEELTGQSTLILPADREDLIIAAIASMYLSGRKDLSITGIIMTGKTKPSPMALTLIKRTNIPVLALQADAYSVASTIHTMNIRMTSSDKPKIEKIINLVKKHVDVNAILKGLGEE